MNKLILIMAIMMAGAAPGTPTEQAQTVTQTEKAQQAALNQQTAQAPQEEDPDAKYGEELLKPGAVAPDFTLNDLDGLPVRLGELRGKRVALVFWASWCPDCRAEVPDLKAMYAEADPDKVTFVSVSYDRDFAALKKFAADNALPGIQLFDPAGKKESKIGADYHVKWIPSLYLIDEDGRIELGTVVASKVAAALRDTSAPGIKAIPGRELCTDESCEL